MLAGIATYPWSLTELCGTAGLTDMDRDEKIARRRAWVVGHPVLASIFLGVPWGLAMGATFGVLNGLENLGATLAQWTAAGLLLFGPACVFYLRQKWKPDTTSN